ncbi:Protein arginine N-methyltransferase [Lachnellula occidentalis]|uniref:Protein arginine N-methyltransferase n=1 Tax=Lachnellula occidentalis TaxID=215460 RepID=A0A8H8RY91_9HELO|nr:Protein arginine N-methyltransferase [Lachnellula occidentalis]
MASKTYIVEHLDDELGPWSELEYLTIARESYEAGAKFCLSSVPPSLELPATLKAAPGFTADGQSVEVLYAQDKSRVCLLDPSATKELSPEDGSTFDVFLFGGILGDDPPRDRTSELRKKGFEGRRLGPKQMTTDTAVRVTRIIVQEQIPLEKISYVDYPELRINKNESTEMPFRYVKGSNGEPIMPEGMEDLIKKDSEKGFGDLF